MWFNLHHPVYIYRRCILILAALPSTNFWTNNLDLSCLVKMSIKPEMKVDELDLFAQDNWFLIVDSSRTNNSHHFLVDPLSILVSSPVYDHICCIAVFYLLLLNEFSDQVWIVFCQSKFLSIFFHTYCANWLSKIEQQFIEVRIKDNIISLNEIFNRAYWEWLFSASSNCFKSNAIESSSISPL